MIGVLLGQWITGHDALGSAATTSTAAGGTSVAAGGTSAGTDRGLVDTLASGKPWTDAPPLRRETTIPSFAPIVRKVRDGVVGIHTLLRNDALARRDDDLADTSASKGVVNGSGFVFNAEGLVVTNYHLVADYEEILVELPGFPPRPANLVGGDPVTDIAVLRIDDPPAGLTVLELGDSSVVEQGDWVLAVGNPFQYRHSVTVGVVSYTGRHIPEEGLLVSNQWLQFSAPVNPGSSGGPVLNMLGEVVGVTTATLGAGTGIAFAVPSKVLRWVIQRMETDGIVERGFLGVRLAPIDQITGKFLGLEGRGAMIRNVKPKTPAARAGLAGGDIVVGFNGRRVPDAYTLFDWISYARPGDEAMLEVMRNARNIAPIRVQLGHVDTSSPSIDGGVGPTESDPSR